MSDDEEIPYAAKKTKTIHYGSLEDAERSRLAAGDAEDSNDKEPAPAPNPPQVHISTGRCLIYY